MLKSAIGGRYLAISKWYKIGTQLLGKASLSENEGLLKVTDSHKYGNIWETI